MKIPQYGYCSPEAMRARQLHNTPPWGVDITEVDALGELSPTDPLYNAWRAAAELRRQIEAGEADAPRA